MKRILIFIAFATFCFFNIKCSKTDGVFIPNRGVNLSFPTNSMLCIDNVITFDWSDAEQTTSNSIIYTIIIAKDRALTNVIEKTTTLQSQITFSLEKETAYYWKVITLNTETNQTFNSEIFGFFTKGVGVANYAPFSSQIVSPVNKSQINVGTISLTWLGSDPNLNDTLTYEVYFSETNPPTLIDDAVTAESKSVTIETGKTYYWKVNVKDDKGAKSIGQIWSFNVN